MTEEQAPDARATAPPVADSTANADDASMAELRSLLLGPAEAQIAETHARLTDPQRQLQEVSRVLPAAVALRTRQDKELSEALGPTVAAAIEHSVRKNPQPLVDAIFPVIGPAIRRAIAAALSSMVGSLNQTMAYSFSAQGLRWRIEAWRTGRPFSEVVLLRTLLYRVEQVFLIHRETGLLLQHVVAPGVPAQDADMVSAMLTAIQDFVRDSFKTQEGDQLEDVKFGPRDLWIEQGPLAVLAGLVRGNAPQDLRLLFEETLERIHFQFNEPLREFAGDAAPFVAVRPLLEDCLQTQLDPEKSTGTAGRKPTQLIGIGAVLLLALLLTGFFVGRRAWRWDAYVESLKREPGIVVTESRRPLLWGKYFVSGLRDPLARDPATLLGAAKVDPAQVVSRWESYQALRPEFVLARAQHLLAPPPTVNLTFAQGTLTATGFASRAWLEANARAVRFIPGVEQFQAAQLFDLEQLERPLLKFEPDQARLAPGQEAQLEQLTADIERMLTVARATGQRVRLELMGHTDGSGPEELNATLSQARAQTIADELSARLASAPDLMLVPTGTTERLRPELTEADRAENRSVTIKVVLLNAR